MEDSGDKRVFSTSPEDCHALAWEGSWDKIPWSSLTQMHFEYKTISQGTILHAAAKQDKLSLVPDVFHTIPNYKKRDRNLQSVFEEALLYKTLWSIPPKLITAETARLPCRGIDSRSLYSHVLEYIRDKDFPTSWLKPELLALEEHKGMFYIHSLARRSRLQYLPKEVFIKDLIELKDSNGSNLLHYAARYEGLSVIPEKFLTKKNLSQGSSNARTPIHWSLSNGNLVGQIPKSILDRKSLYLQDSLGETCLHCAATSRSLYQFEQYDPKLLNEKALLIKDLNGKSPLDIILDSYYTPNNINNLIVCLKKLSFKKLQDILETRKDVTIVKEVGKEIVRRRLAMGAIGSYNNKSEGKENLGNLLEL